MSSFLLFVSSCVAFPAAALISLPSSVWQTSPPSKHKLKNSHNPRTFVEESSRHCFEVEPDTVKEGTATSSRALASHQR